MFAVRPLPLRTLALAAGFALASLGAPDIASGATTATPQGSFLKAKLPGEMKRISEVRDTLVGDVEHHTVTSTVNGAELSITATELPGFVTTVTTDNMLYRKARRELLKNYAGSSKGWSSCRHAGYTCRKLRYTADDGREGLARFYIHDDVLVVVNAVYRDDAEVAERFLDSVK